MNLSTDIGVWLAALVTLGLTSFVFKENAFYRVIESLFVGVAAGHGITLGWSNIRNLALKPLVEEGRWSVIFAIALGIMLFARYFTKWARVSRIPMNFLMGIGAGLAMRGVVGSQIVNQVKACYLPLNSVNNVIIAVGTLAVLSYFFFTVEQKGAFGKMTTFGRYIMMLGFGAAYGGTATGRISLFVGRVQFLLTDWLGIVK